ncbi:hypothetical protein [Arcanobacterium pinnipediorum]|uniref:Uncharacterized protein n=1 Tax=Arcanobacterium pinnipediorum TaxID=1503041 RepID=A0ABY5AH28_9ACTO|nr:hypothetical protein [Arcanobacterium pinnipediorum]USR79300.1 hypothetical protein NG665_07975 [Arcanobacterium pinnipediorum]
MSLTLVPDNNTTREVASATASAQGVLIEARNRRIGLTWEETRATHTMLADLLNTYPALGGDVA